MADDRLDERFAIEGDPEDALRDLLKEPARVDTCPDCLGDGFSKEPGAKPLDKCAKCKGTGKVPAGQGVGRPRIE